MSYELTVRPEKVEAVEVLKGQLTAAGSLVVTEYRGLTVGQLAELRTKLREAGATYRVIKNTLARRAANESGLADMAALFVGPTAVVYVDSDPVAGAKAVVDFSSANEALVVKGAWVDGKAMNAEETSRLAKTDPLPVSLAKIAGGLTGGLAAVAAMLEAPLARIAYVLQERGKQSE